MQEMTAPVVPQLLILLTAIRRSQGLSQEDLADAAGIHRTYVGLIEKGERVPTVAVAARLSEALGYSLSSLLQQAESIVTGSQDEASFLAAQKARIPKAECLRNQQYLSQYLGLDSTCILETIRSTYRTLDTIDHQLLATSSPPISRLVELANLSSMVGNLVGASLAEASNGLYARNKPHHYPDLLPLKSTAVELELKMALETNRPKGHLPKSGNYITFRYVLGDRFGKYSKGKENRGNTVWIWEIKAGHIKEEDFDISNTMGDSGKTAVIKTSVFNNMPILYFDASLLPYSEKHKVYSGV
jgi:transcriptional regulator with XRE-family HTH domain